MPGAAYLVANPPARSQFRRPRRETPSGVVVVHTAENTPDTVATDGGAEAVARFIRDRPDPGSYHDLADSDSVLLLVPYDAEAFQDGTGSNPHAYAVSVATRADWWPWAPAAWREGAVRNAARAAAGYASWLRTTHGIVIPARRITRAESDARVPGFISHAERDPARRSDPGSEFPWLDFLDTFAALTDQEDSDMEAQFILGLYAGFFGALPGAKKPDGTPAIDPPGFNFWLTAALDGTPRDQIRAGFAKVAGL